MLRLYIFLMALISLFVACNSGKKIETASRIDTTTEKEVVRQIAIDTPKTDAIKPVSADTVAEKKKK